MFLKVTVDNLAGDPLQAEHTARHALCNCSEKYGGTWQLQWDQASHRAVQKTFGQLYFALFIDKTMFS